jgi:nitrate reductase gamma subunit
MLVGWARDRKSGRDQLRNLLLNEIEFNFSFHFFSGSFRHLLALLPFTSLSIYEGRQFVLFYSYEIHQT